MIRLVSENRNPLPEPHYQFIEITDPAQIAEARAVDAAAKRNGDWLQHHWADITPQADGKFVAVAGQEAFIADSVQGAVALAAAAHPEDKGILVQYVSPELGPKIYGIRG